MVQHDQMMKPVVSHKYDIGFIVENCDLNILYAIEPWCSTIYTDCKQHEYDIYIKNEQPNTKYDLSKKKVFFSTVLIVILTFFTYNLRNVQRLHKEINFYKYNLTKSPFFYVKEMKSAYVLIKIN